MKIAKIALIVLISVTIVSLSYAGTVVTPANKTGATVATSDALQHKPGMKAERGMKNILLGWTEIPNSIIQVTRDSKNPIWGLTGGLFKGIGKAFPRTISGVADVVSFPIASYEKTPISPDGWDTQVK